MKRAIEYDSAAPSSVKRYKRGGRRGRNNKKKHHKDQRTTHSDGDSNNSYHNPRRTRLHTHTHKSNRITKSGSDMHAHNRYRENPPDFKALGEAYPTTFGRFLKPTRHGGMTLDWTDAASIMALTVVLFQHDFNIDFRMPLHHLCPPLPRSLNYIHWIGELLGEQPLPLEQQLLTTPSSLSSSSSSSLPSPGGRLIHGLDIGTGASCVFPLLGYSTYRWRFTGSEVDEESVQSSRETLSRNGLQDVIKVYHNKDRSKILAGVLDRLTTEDVSSDHTAETEHTTDKSDPTDALAEGGSDEEEKRVDEKENETSETEGERARRSKYRFDFVMCNPPFFDEMGQTGLNKKRACQATASELVCPGGEYAFVSQMVLESRQFAGQVRWFTSMVGRKGTLQKIERMLKTASLFTQTQTPVQHVTQCTFSQGKQARWAIAWTFDREEKERQMQKLRQEFVKQQEAKLRRQYQGKRSIDFTVHLTSSPSTASFLSVSAPSSSASSLSSASTFFAGVAEVMGCIQRGASLHAEGLNRADSSTVYASETSVDDDGWVLEGRLTRETAVSVSVGTAEQKRVCSGTSTADIGSALPPVLSNSALLSSSSPTVAAPVSSYLHNNTTPPNIGPAMPAFLMSRSTSEENAPIPVPPTAATITATTTSNGNTDTVDRNADTEPDDVAGGCIGPAMPPFLAIKMKDGVAASSSSPSPSPSPLSTISNPPPTCIGPSVPAHLLQNNIDRSTNDDDGDICSSNHAARHGPASLHSPCPSPSGVETVFRFKVQVKQLHGRGGFLVSIQYTSAEHNEENKDDTSSLADFLELALHLRAKTLSGRK